MTMRSVDTAPRCTALYNLLLKYLWFPYKIKVIINNFLLRVFCKTDFTNLRHKKKMLTCNCCICSTFISHICLTFDLVLLWP